MLLCAGKVRTRVQDLVIAILNVKAQKLNRGRVGIVEFKSENVIRILVNLVNGDHARMKARATLGINNLVRAQMGHLEPKYAGVIVIGENVNVIYVIQMKKRIVM